MPKNRTIEYIREILCFLGFHFGGRWENKSEFIDTGIGFNFGWIARWGKKCNYCEKIVYRRPFLLKDRKRMIHEANEKKTMNPNKPKANIYKNN